MADPHVISRIDNIGFDARGRRFAGYPKVDGRQTRLVEPRGLIHLSVKAGDLLRLDAVTPETAILIAIAPDGAEALAALGVAPNGAIPRDALEMPQFDGWGAGSGGLADAPACARAEISAEPLVIAAKSDLDLWIGNPLSAMALATGQTGGTITVSRKRQSHGPSLPDPFPGLKEEFTVQRGTAMAYELLKGQRVQILDIEGQQCSDFQALTLRALDRGQEAFIDGTATRSMVRRAYPGPGLMDKFFDIALRPMLKVVQDTCGRHDTFGLACTARGYEERGFPGHLNCSDNISQALSPFDVTPRSAWPAINFFWSTWIGHDQALRTEEGWSRAGDYVVMEAMEDLVCVSTACPDDIDPINGWNPTDILVRVYDDTARISRATGYREKEDGPMLTGEESPFHPRLSPLTEHFAPARDLWAPVSFPSSGVLGEYWACREAVTVQDMSGLRKFDIIGPDAAALLQRATTRNVAKLAEWRGHYTLLCDPTGAVIDDGTLFRLGADLFRFCCGTEEAGRALQALAEAEGYQVRINAMRNALPNLAVQGPNSRELIQRVAFTQPTVPHVDQVKWFGATVARLGDREGAPFLLTRSGYTGDLGYEIFCSKGDAITIWDALFAAGADLGVKPMGLAALEILRVEAGLAAAGAEFAPGVSAYEAGLGFAVDLKKEDFIGRDALVREEAAPAKRLMGLKLDCNDVPLHNAPVMAGERQIGVVTSATRSPHMGTAIALARLAVEYAEIGTVLEIGQLDGRMKRLRATVAAPAFFDPKRERARA